jgi:hypothetical protein
MNKIQVSKKAVAMGCTFALAVALVVVSDVPAATQEIPAPTLIKHVLIATYYDATSGANASCNTTGCVATANVATESIPCPGATGVKCTYEVNVAAQSNMVSPGEGLYQFLIDGTIPSGGGTDVNGFWIWGIAGPSGPGSMSGSAAYSVNSQVTNTNSNQLHSIVVNLGCAMGNPGCTVNSSQTSLTVRVLKP